MITLTRKKESQWLDLVQGVRLQVMPFDTIRVMSARLKGAEVVRQLLAGVNAVDGFDVVAAGYDLTDAAVQRAISHTITVCSIAYTVVIAWEGVGDENGDPLPVSPEAVRDLMLIPGIADDFIQKYEAAYSIDQVAEGNA